MGVLSPAPIKWPTTLGTSNSKRAPSLASTGTRPHAKNTCSHRIKYFFNSRGEKRTALQGQGEWSVLARFIAWCSIPYIILSFINIYRLIIVWGLLFAFLFFLEKGTCSSFRLAWDSLDSQNWPWTSVRPPCLSPPLLGSWTCITTPSQEGISCGNLWCLFFKGAVLNYRAI